MWVEGGVEKCENEAGEKLNSLYSRQFSMHSQNDRGFENSFERASGQVLSANRFGPFDLGIVGNIGQLTS